MQVLTVAPADPMKTQGNWPLHGILFQARRANTGLVYIGDRPTMDKTTLAGVLAVLAIPTDNALPTFSAALTWSPNALQLETFWIDADDAGDGCLVSVLVT